MEMNKKIPAEQLIFNTGHGRSETLAKLCDVLVYMAEWIERQDEEERTGIVTGSRYDREHDQMWRFRRMCEEYREIRSDVVRLIGEFQDQIEKEGGE